MIHIGLDFDDTLIDMRKSIVRLLNALHQKDLIYEDIKEYGVSDLYGYTFDEFIEFFSNNQAELHIEKPYRYVKEVLNNAAQEAKFTIITGRPTDWIEAALRWTEVNQLPVKEVVCASQYRNGKVECADLRDITLFIEDHPDHAMNLAENGIEVLLLDKPYNQNCLHNKIRRVKDWEEIGGILEYRF